MSRIEHDEYMLLRTLEEGGVWIPVPRDKSHIPKNQELERLRSEMSLHVNHIEIRGMRVHSFQTNTGREWDCVNGWRRGTGTKK